MVSSHAPADAVRDDAGHFLVPAPLYSQHGPWGFEPGGRVLLDPGESQVVREQAKWLAGLITDLSPFEVAVAESSSDPAIRLETVDEAELAGAFRSAGLDVPGRIEEAYRLVIAQGGVTVSAAHDTGLFRGMVSLWQILASLPDGANEWPGLDILDAPEFGWRGLMLDSARHMQSVGYIKNHLDWMALHKLNVFHWHLTDDQSWRLEIKRYPKLAEIGGYRVPAGDAPAADIDPATGEPRLYGGYYTQEQVREIVAHAAKRHITVVPEVDVPGHATAAIAAMPELGVEGHGVDRVSASWGIFHNVFNLEESTFEVLEGVLAEMVELFPGPFIHLGGDEVELDQWKESNRTRARMEEIGIQDFQSVQNYYVERLQAFLDPHGKRVIGWDEILESDLPPHAAVMSWRGVQGAIEAAAKGHETVLSPAPTLYLDHIQTTAPDAPPGRGGVITLRDIYEFDPLPDSLGENRDKVLGLQGNLWTEHVRTEERAAYMTWPRAAAIAELGWTAPENRDWHDFAARVPAAVTRMHALGIPAASDAHALYREPLPVRDTFDVRRNSRELELCSNAIVLALEDDAPVRGERKSFLVDVHDPCWIWKNAELTTLEAIRASVGQLPFNFEIGESIHSVVVRPPHGEHGEMLIRLGSCHGPIVGEAPLAPAVGSHATTELAPVELELPADAGDTADLCFSFTRHGVEPIWVIDWIELVREAE